MLRPKLILRSTTNTTHGTVSVLFYIQREKVYFTTKVMCLTADWDNIRCRIKKTDPEFKDKNLILSNILSRITDVDVKHRLKDKNLTKEIFLKHYHRPSDYDTFFEFFDACIKKQRRKMEPATLKLHKSCINKLRLYNENLSFDDMNHEFLDDYLYYIRRDLKNNDNTAHKNLTVIKKYVLQAIREGYMETNPFENFHVHQSKPNIVFLEEDELQRMWNFYKAGDYPDKYISTLQTFLFLCFSSLHIGDARKLRIEDFNNVTFTYYRVKLQNKKPDMIHVPISLPLRMLMNDIAGDRSGGFIFLKLLPDQKMNFYLKEIAGYVGIEKRISLKTGRHTFATIFLENNPNPKVLQEILGHSDIKQTMNYVHALEKTKQRGIGCFDKFTESILPDKNLLQTPE